MEKTPVVLTVDTEFSTHKDDIGVFGEINGTRYGVPLLADMLDRHQLKATFFVDVYTKRVKYWPEFQRVCLNLRERGHDLQLHTHPDGTFDASRWLMHQYSLDEQITIIEKGKELFRKYLECDPIAHRAGDWAANYDTLRALEANGILFDSSMFYGWPKCHLNQPPLTRNACIEHDGVLEIPASAFECAPLGVFAPFRLLSTDGNPFDETIRLFRELRTQGVKVINTVYHSFSFLRWNAERTKYYVAENRIKKFGELLKALSESDEFVVKTIADIASLYQSKREAVLGGSDVLPRTGVGASLIRVVDRVRGYY